MSIDIKKRLSKALAPILDTTEEALYRLIEIPPDTDLGDFAVPFFFFAKEYKKNPAQIASDFQDRLIKKADNDGMLRTARAKGPYLNIFVNKANVVNEVVRSLFPDRNNIPGETGKGKTVVCDSYLFRL